MGLPSIRVEYAGNRSTQFVRILAKNNEGKKAFGKCQRPSMKGKMDISIRVLGGIFYWIKSWLAMTEFINIAIELNFNPIGLFMIMPSETA